MKDTATLLAKAQKEFEDEQQKLREQFHKKQSALLDKVRNQLADAFKDALKIYDSIPQPARGAILFNEMFKDILKAFGLTYKVKFKGSKGLKAHVTSQKVTDEQVLAFLATEHTTGDVASHFAWSAVTVGKKLNALLKAKLITMRDDELPKKFWKKA